MSGLQVLNQTIVCCCDVLLYFFAKKESNIFFPFAYNYTVYDFQNNYLLLTEPHISKSYCSSCKLNTTGGPQLSGP